LIEANIKKIGVDPHSINTSSSTMGHTDHFGRRKRLQDLPRARHGDARDWKMIADTAGKPNNRDNGKPTGRAQTRHGCA